MKLISNEVSDPELTGLLLRDFFIAQDFSSIQAAYHALCPEDAKQEMRIEYDFNALFIGPKALLAAPYASVYLDEDALLMGKATQELREFMQALGLSITANNILDDHISCEIELAVLLLKASKNNVGMKEALTRYVMSHLDKWLPGFIEKINEHAQTEALKNVAVVLLHWLRELKMRVSL